MFVWPLALDVTSIKSLAALLFWIVTPEALTPAKVREFVIDRLPVHEYVPFGIWTVMVPLSGTAEQAAWTSACEPSVK